MKKNRKAKPIFPQFLGNVVVRPFQKIAGSGINEPLLRGIIGGLGFALPIILVAVGLGLHGWPPLGSLSDYYIWRTRDAFVGILFVIGWFLFAYKGYEKIDAIAGKLACLFALGVALFPNTEGSWERYVHFTCATLMFMILAFFSLYLFTKTDTSPQGLWPTVKSFRFRAAWRGEKVKTEKRNRNRVYIICGVVIAACIVLVAIYNLFFQHTVIENIKPVLILETIMIWAFGFSWFVKSNLFILKD
jgi:hypothetical protein